MRSSPWDMCVEIVSAGAETPGQLISIPTIIAETTSCGIAGDAFLWGVIYVEAGHNHIVSVDMNHLQFCCIICILHNCNVSNKFILIGLIGRIGLIGPIRSANGRTHYVVHNAVLLDVEFAVLEELQYLVAILVEVVDARSALRSKRYFDETSRSSAASVNIN